MFDTHRDSVSKGGLPRSSVSSARLFWADISRLGDRLFPEYPVSSFDSSLLKKRFGIFLGPNDSAQRSLTSLYEIRKRNAGGGVLAGLF